MYLCVIMQRAFIYGPRMRGMTHAGQFEPSPRTPPPPYPAAPYANLRTPGGFGRVPIVTLRGVFAPRPRPLGISLSTLRAIRNRTQLPQNNRHHQILIDSLFGVLAPAPGERERRHPGPGNPARFAPSDRLALRTAGFVAAEATTCQPHQRPGSRGRTIQKNHSVPPMITSMPRESHPVPMPFAPGFVRR